MPGQCKTRLVPPLTPEQAASLYHAFCRDILSGFRNISQDIWITYEPLGKFTSPDWIAPGVPFFHQRGACLGEKMIHAFKTLFDKKYQRIVAIGTDAPTLPSAYVQKAFKALSGHEVVLGPAEDGGYYLMGLRALYRKLFKKIPWSTQNVMSETKKALKRLNLSAFFLPLHYDVDSIHELKHLSQEKNLKALCPATAALLEQELSLF